MLCWWKELAVLCGTRYAIANQEEKPDTGAGCLTYIQFQSSFQRFLIIQEIYEFKVSLIILTFAGGMS
jgi:hypothetical protein